jgi:hypothetical protein
MGFELPPALPLARLLFLLLLQRAGDFSWDEALFL